MKEEFILYIKEQLQVMTLKFMHDWTHSVKDTVTNEKIAQTQWEDFFNKTFLNEGVSIAV